MRSPVLVCGILLGISFGAGSSAQEPDPGAVPPIFGETVDVRVVNLEVVVTDRDGLPVTGLGAEDFRLLVDRTEVPVGFFSEVRGGLAVDIAPDPAAARASLAGIPDIVPGSPVGTSYLVFIDDFFSLARDRDRVLRAMVDDLGRLGPEDRMAVVAYDGGGIEMLSSWSGSTGELEKAFRKAIGRPALGIQRLTERRSFLEEGSGRRGAFSPRNPIDTRLDVTERFYADRLDHQVSSAVSAVSSTLRGFANPPGRKVLILLSGGWPYDITEFVIREFGRVSNEPGITRGDRLYAPLVDTANQLGYTIYGVDVPGLSSDFDTGAEMGELPASGERFTSFVREHNAQYALQYVSRETGGRALINAGRTEALQRAAADTRTYYWIGFAPTWQGDDRRHDVEVEVRRPGFKVRSRAGYVDMSRRREVSMAVESVLMFGDGAGVQPLRVALGEPQRKSSSVMTVDVKIQVPIHGLTFLPVGGRRVTDLELRVAAIDDRGGRSEVPVLPVRMTIDADPQPGQFAIYETALELRRVKNRIVVALYDPASGTIWSATAEVRP